MNKEDRLAMLWGAMPGIGYTLLMVVGVWLLQPQGLLGFVGLVFGVFASVDILRWLGWRVVRKYLLLVVIVMFFYWLLGYAAVRWGVGGVLLVIVGLALWRLLRNRSGYLSAIKSFDHYLKKWDPSWGKNK